MSVGELYILDSARTADARRIGVQKHAHAFLFDEAAQDVGAGRIELALHQPIHDMGERHVDAASRKAIGRLQSEKAAADDERARAFAFQPGQRLDVLHVAKRVNARKIGALDRQPCRARTRGEHDFRIVDALAIIEKEAPRRGVDLDDLAAAQNLNAGGAPPLRGA